MTRDNVAVIGGGVSGLTAAHILQRRHDVTVFEAAPRLGGHADTQLISAEAALDTAFVIFSERFYPNFARLLNELGVTSQPADLVVDIVCDDCGFAHVGADLFGTPLLPKRPTGVSREEWDNVSTDCARFGPALADAMSAGGSGPTVRQVLDQRGFSRFFATHYVYPMVGSLYLQPPRRIDEMPLKFLGDTLSRYGLMGADALATWRTVTGASHTYVRAVAGRLFRVRTGTRVQEVRRSGAGVSVKDSSGTVHDFAKVVIATHAPETLRILTDPPPDVREVLHSIRYAPFEAALHTDQSVLNGTGEASNTILHVTCAANGADFRSTYRAGLVHKLGEPEHQYLCSQNMTAQLAPEKVLRVLSYEHPVVTPESFALQERILELSDDVVAFAGAYAGNGFHEAGCASGVHAAKALGVTWE
jgi:predicted NAD/FAD-binding protein